MLSLLCGGGVVAYTAALVRLFRQRGPFLWIGVAIAAILPCLVISSWGAEADTLQALLMSGFLFHISYAEIARKHRRLEQLGLAGAMAGLALATKYNGLVCVATVVVLVGVRLIVGPRRRARVTEGIAIVAIALTIGSWSYVANWRKYGTPLFANGSAAEGFSQNGTGRHGQCRFSPASNRWRSYVVRTAAPFRHAHRAASILQRLRTLHAANVDGYELFQSDPDTVMVLRSPILTRMCRSLLSRRCCSSDCCRPFLHWRVPSQA